MSQCTGGTLWLLGRSGLCKTKKGPSHLVCTRRNLRITPGELAVWISLMYVEYGRCYCMMQPQEQGLTVHMWHEEMLFAFQGFQDVSHSPIFQQVLQIKALLTFLICHVLLSYEQMCFSSSLWQLWKTSRQESSRFIYRLCLGNLCRWH